VEVQRLERYLDALEAGEGLGVDERLYVPLLSLACSDLDLYSAVVVLGAVLLLGVEGEEGQTLHRRVRDVLAPVDLSYVALDVQDVHVLLGLKHDGGYGHL
jgi:hypothetical protein